MAGFNPPNMAQRLPAESPKNAQPGDVLLAVHEFSARSPDEISLIKGDRIELIEKDDDFGDGWYLAKHLTTGNVGLFPEVYTIIPPKPTASRQQTQATQPHLSLVTPGQNLPNNGVKSPPPSTGNTPLNPGAPPSTPSHPNLIAKLPSPMAGASNTQARNLGSGRSTPGSSSVMNEMHNVINEHITDLNKPKGLEPRYNGQVQDPRPSSGGSASLYSRADMMNNDSTDDENTVPVGPFTVEGVKAWSPARVALYLESVGVEKSHYDLFREEEFTGEVLLEMDQSQVFMKEFNLGPIGRRMRTWHKIKALQDEVKSAVNKPTLLPTGNRTVSEGYPSPSPSQVFINDRRRATAFGSISSIPEQEQVRPSAASVREFGHSHSRRHSSMDQTLVASPNASDKPASRRIRGKQGSFDRGWTMDPTSGSISNSPRPLSTTHLATPASDMGGFGKSAGSSQLSLTNADKVDLDRGYVSGGELDNRRPRNVLRKSHGSTDHKRLSSYGSSDGRRISKAFFWHKSREDKSGNSTDDVGPKRISHVDGVRIVSEPTKGQTSPAVTRLEYDDDSASSKRLSGISTKEAQRSSVVSDSRMASSARRGLRTISDAVTGKERALAEHPGKFSPAEGSLVQSPDEYEPSPAAFSPVDANKGAFSTPSSAVATSGTRRKQKQQTSAYVRGLQKKSPGEQKVGADYSGWMKKKSSNFMTNWKPRYFVLRGLRLSYYYSEDDVEEKGLIDISNHRVLPANGEFITSLHAALTGNRAPNSAPGTFANNVKPNGLTHGSMMPTFASSNIKDSSKSEVFIFKLVPPRSGLSKGVNFTKPAVHYFAVPSLAEGRLWMAELMKATIDRDESVKVVTTYQQKTITLEQARARREMPPFLRDVTEKDKQSGAGAGAQEGGEEGEEGGGELSPKVRGGADGDNVTSGIESSSIDDKSGKPPSSDADAEGSTTAGSSIQASSYATSVQGSYNAPGLQQVQREGPADLPQIVTNMERVGGPAPKDLTDRLGKEETPTTAGLGIQGLSSGTSQADSSLPPTEESQKEAALSPTN